MDLDYDLPIGVVFLNICSFGMIFEFRLMVTCWMQVHHQDESIRGWGCLRPVVVL
jgi:hypothetical protein